MRKRLTVYWHDAYIILKKWTDTGFEMDLDREFVILWTQSDSIWTGFECGHLI